MLQKQNLGGTPAEKDLSLNSKLHDGEELVHAHHEWERQMPLSKLNFLK